MKKALTPQEALQQAAAYCSVAERCEADVRAKLEQWQLDAADADAVVARLESERFLDAERFCRAYISDKYRFAKWGRRKIQQGLYMKQLPRAIYEPLMDEVIDQDEYLENLRHLLNQKRRSVRQSDPYKLKAALLRFAAGRGFLASEVMQCLDDADCANDGDYVDFD